MENKIRFKINDKKAIEVVFYILSKYKDQGVNRYNLLKMIFAADKYHLNTYASPVTGDSYIKMKHGTVPSFIYNFIKGSCAIEDYKHLSVQNHFIKSNNRNYNNSLLSESDIEALDYGIKEYHGMTFSDVAEKNHNERCWINTFTMNNFIDFELMIDDEEIIKDLKENSINIVI